MLAVNGPQVQAKVKIFDVCRFFFDVFACLSFFAFAKAYGRCECALAVVPIVVIIMTNEALSHRKTTPGKKNSTIATVTDCWFCRKHVGVAGQLVLQK